jgi:hypothetical protein
MKKLFTILFLLTAFISNAQRTLFGGNNNYVAPVAPPVVVTNGLILYLNASSYSGAGTTWNDASTQNNTATLVGIPTYTSSPASFTFGPNVIATTTKSNVALTTATFIAWVNSSQTQEDYTSILMSRNGMGSATNYATGMNFASGGNNSIGYHWNDDGGTFTEAGKGWKYGAKERAFLREVVGR